MRINVRSFRFPAGVAGACGPMRIKLLFGVLMRCGIRGPTDVSALTGMLQKYMPHKVDAHGCGSLRPSQYLFAPLCLPASLANKAEQREVFRATARMLMRMGRLALFKPPP